jgi:hypothetical protein
MIRILATDSFQWVAIPLVLAFVTAIASALGSHLRVARLDQFFVGIDLTIEAFAINLALLATSAKEVVAQTGSIPSGLLDAFLAALFSELVILFAVMGVQRFAGPTFRYFAMTNGLGVASLFATMLLWRAQE